MTNETASNNPLLCVSYTTAGYYTDEPYHENQDAVFTVPDDSGKGFLVGVLDGMSSGGLGATASGAAARAIQAQWAQIDKREAQSDPIATVYTLMGAAQRSVLGALGQQSGGTTCLIVLIQGDLLTLAHVGDGQLFHCTQYHSFQLITKDQSALYRTNDGRALYAKQQRGTLSNEEQRTYAYLENALTRYLGHHELSADTPKQWTEVGQLKLGRGDTLLLCSDGLIKLTTIERQRLPLPTVTHSSIESYVTDLINAYRTHSENYDDTTICVIEVVGELTPVAKDKIQHYQELTVIEVGEEEERLQLSPVSRHTNTEPRPKAPSHTDTVHIAHPATSSEPVSQYKTTTPPPIPPVHGVEIPDSTPAGETRTKRTRPPKKWQIPKKFLPVAGITAISLVLVMCMVGVTNVIGMFIGSTATATPVAIAIVDTAIPTPAPWVKPTDTTVLPSETPTPATPIPTSLPTPSTPSTVVSGTAKPPVYDTFTLLAGMVTDFTTAYEFLRMLFGDSPTGDTAFDPYFKAYGSSVGKSYSFPTCLDPDWAKCIQPGQEVQRMLPMYPWLALDGTSISSAESGGGFLLQVGAEIYHIEGHETINSQIVTDSHVVVIGTVAHATDSVNNWEQSGNWENLQLDGEGIILVKPIFVRYDNGNWLMMNEQTEQNLLNRPVWLYSNHAPLLNELVEDNAKGHVANHETVLVNGMWSPNHVTPQLVVTAVYAFDDASQSYRCVASPGRPNAACP